MVTSSYQRLGIGDRDREKFVRLRLSLGFLHSISMATSESTSRSPQPSGGLANKDGTSVSIGDKIMKYINESLPQKFKKLLMIEDVAHCCRYCRGAVRPYNDFCRELCALKYWELLRTENAKVRGNENWLCSLPGCDKLCWVENDGRVRDYCKKTHADEHQRMKERFQQNHLSNTGPIYFYDKYDDYYEFTNFYPAEIILDEKEWQTTEHYFQAQKFVGTPHLDMIRRASSAREAFEYSRKPSVSQWCRKDWEDVKLNIMRKALLAKFIQNPELRRKLIETGHRHLIERSSYDSFWGDGPDGSGKNYLGILLMEVRDQICR